MIDEKLLIKDIEEMKINVLSHFREYPKEYRDFIRDIYDQFIGIVNQQPNLYEETIEPDYIDMINVKRKFLTINEQRMYLGMEKIPIKDVGEWKYHD